ncbi:MAG: 2,3-bisphosphoglycerate-independent phosphoglycerate mutase [Clostridiales bacterium]|nr:2,3-bisphosphoglycerate-independent phosphoglycerate mutase [Clostridiales bacterium]
MRKRPTVLIVMDGFGLAEPSDTNAVATARKPNLDRLMAEYPTTPLRCQGMDVGLPDGQMGNSEVGHLNLGAGRIVYQPLTRVSKSILDGDFFSNPALTGAMDHARGHGTALHLMGLVSNGGVHSHIDHLLALVRMGRDAGISRIFIHCFMDGRDVPPSSGKAYIETLERSLLELSAGRIATVSGRFYAMDRDNMWERVAIAYDALTLGQGVTATSAAEAMEQSYANGETDEFVRPTVILKDGRPTGTIGENDAVIFFNFRPDRARQLTRSYIDPAFDEFERKKGYFPLYFATMTTYDATFDSVHVAFGPQESKNTLGEYLSKLGKTQFHIAETQKYAHVTYFFNGGIEKPYPGEDRILIDSPKIETFDLKPDMSAREVTDAAIERIESGKYDAIFINYANCDMVGHTGVMDAAVAAVETVDACVGRAVEATRRAGGQLIITADHGNAEKMWDEEAEAPYTAHTIENPVPLIVVDDRHIGKTLRGDGRLADVAPTFLELMGIPQPPEMTGRSLLHL